MNEELIVSAVSFLKDPNVNSAPFTKKVEFLESKGLNQQEIEEAIKRSNNQESSQVSNAGSVSSSSPASYGNQTASVPNDYYNYAPPVPDRSWKDYFIMATATAGVAYGMYQVVTKYLIPSLVPPSQTSIEEDKQKIDDEFIKIDKLLEQLAADQAEIKEANEAKSKDIDTVINNVNDFLSKYNKDKLSFDDDLRLMKLEVENLRNSIEKNMNNTKQSIKQELEDIGEELESLKQLVQARAAKQAALGELAPRKIAPVSSIPSASEILRKAKASKAETPKPVSPIIPNDIEKEVSKPTTPVSAESLSSTSYKPIASAAGIPEWQLKHKLEEEERQKQKEQKDQLEQVQLQEQEMQEAASSSGNFPGIPSWQEVQAENEKKVETAIANNGVPAWQLNASN